MSAAVREARGGEEASIVPLYEWLFAPPGAKPAAWDPDSAEKRLATAIAAPESTVLLAEDQGGICAFCTAYIDIHSVRFGTRCWVEDLAVAPDRRSQGTGAAILAAARTWARARGASHLELDSANTRVDAHRFYEREGGLGDSRVFGWVL